MNLGEVLRVCEQIASALAAAHGAGVVHRDVKPENVMVRRDGYVKVLDFGLAKLTEHAASSADTEAQTRALVKTDPGSVMGTVSYMSPEQAGAREVDARTDIWSLGVVLHEMVTGQLPFHGRSPGHTIVAIQDEEPPPLSLFMPDVPEALQEIVNDALAKDPEARPTAKQLLARLGRLRSRLNSGTSRDHSIAPNMTTVMDARLSSVTMDPQPGVPSTFGGMKGSTTSAASGVQIANSQSGAAQATPARRWGRSVAAGVALLAVVLAAAAFAAYRLGWLGKTKAPAGQMKITQLTSTGQASDVDISPDGKYIVHVKAEGGRRSLWLRQVETTSDTQIVPPTDDTLTGIAFSRDGTYIYYLRAIPNTAVGALYQMPLLGGAARKLKDDVRTRITLSPDGKLIACLYRQQSNDPMKIALIPFEGGEPVRLLDFSQNFISSPGLRWTPDSQAILYAETQGGVSNIWRLPVEGGAPKQITDFKEDEIFWFDFSRDGRQLALSLGKITNDVVLISNFR